MARTFDLSDIIAEEVEKALKARTAAEPSGTVFDIKDITKFLSELAKLKSQTQALAPTPQPVAAPAPVAPAKPKPENIYNAVIQTIDKIVPVLGDMKLSEVKTYMVENKTAVLSLIEANL
jgi:hypothetical protein